MRRNAAAVCIALVTGVAGCSESPTKSTDPAPPPAPAVGNWSDPRMWPNGLVPVAGSVVSIPAGHTIVLDLTPPDLKSLEIVGRLTFDRSKDLGLTASWIIVRGTLEVGTEGSPYTKRAIITINGSGLDNVQGVGAKVIGVLGGGVLDIHGEKRMTWARLASTVGAGSNQLVLEQAPDWRVGDVIVVASTDFDPAQTEEATVMAVAGASVTVSPAFRYDHFGQKQSFVSRTVDERAEVGLLSHNITIRGDDISLRSQIGAHILVTQGGVARVEGAELYLMGQLGVKARYPMHWHMAGSVAGQYFRGNAVWRTFNRCLTIHGTNDLHADHNVCYDHTGHGYFFEDGAEVRNVLESNLALRGRATTHGVLPTDQSPANFWITNPDNTLRGNVAAGSEGFGFWFALPEHPTGLSVGDPALPRHTPLREFADNVAHSSYEAGLFVDSGPKLDGTTETTSFEPRQTPGADSPAVPGDFHNFTAYKHYGRGVWLRGYQLRLTAPVLADNAIGATFASSETFVQDALFVGQTANTAGNQIDPTFPIRGYEFYDGRVGAERATFVNYPSGRGRIMSALGFNRQNYFTVNTGNFASQLQFVNANRVYLENPLPDRDGDKSAAIFDEDGSITGTAGNYIVANNSFLVTSACQYRPEWNAHVCPHSYVGLQIQGDNGEAIAPLTLTRDDGVSVQVSGIPDYLSYGAMTLLQARSYSAAYQGTVPDRPFIYVNHLRSTDWVKLALPYASTSFHAYRDYDYSKTMLPLSSLADLDTSTGDHFYYDPSAQVLYLKLQSQAGRDWTTVFVVP